MAEINITQFYNDATPSTYSASQAELGPDAGRITWANAQQRAAYGTPLLKTPEEMEAMRAWVESTGAWTEGLPDADLNPLFIQLISCDIRERNDLCNTWPEYYELAEQCLVSGTLFEADGQIYYVLGG